MSSVAAKQTGSASKKFDVEGIRLQFPILTRKVHGQPLVYFDNAATTQKPQVVIDSLVNYYTEYNSNVHRGVHYLSGIATDAYEAVRKKVQQLINANSDKEINFTRGTTESINLVAQTYGRKFIGKDDEIIISGMEHHSNIVPWQMLCEETGAKLKVIPVTDEGELRMDEFEKLLSKKTKIVSVVYVSNALGTINPVREIINRSHSAGAVVVLDAAQAVQHLPLDVQELNCDFFCFSGHKMYGPTGIGILYGKERLLNEMPPWHGGGEMIKSVTFQKTTYNDLPFKFEAGTPNIADGIALGAAIDFITEVGLEEIHAYENELLQYGQRVLNNIPGVRFIGNAKEKASVLPFLVDDHHPYDVGVILDHLGIAIRTGHHCCQPLMDQFKIEGTCRASLALYNTKQELDKLAEGIERAKKML